MTITIPVVKGLVPISLQKWFQKARHRRNIERLQAALSARPARLEDLPAYFNRLLELLLRASGSEFGFIGEVHGQSDNLHLRTYAITDHSWNTGTRARYAESPDSGKSFRNPDSLLGYAISHNRLVISNSPANDPRASGHPDGHPVLDSFMAMPLRDAHGRIVGLVALGNRPGGFRASLHKQLRAFLAELGMMVGQLRAEEERDRQRQVSSELQSQLAEILKEVEDVIWSQSLPDGRLLYVSPSVEQMYELPLSEWYADVNVWRKLIHPDDRELIRRSVEAFREWGRMSLEFRIITLSGKTKWLYARSRYIYDADNNPIRIDAIVTDITIRKKAQEDIEKFAFLFNEAQRIGQIGAWELDVETEKAIWTDEVYRIHEVDRGFDNNKESAISFYFPEDQLILREAIFRAVERGLSYDLTFRLTTARGNVRWVRHVGHPQFESGKVVRLLGTIQDITESRKSQISLTETMDRMTGIIEALPLSLILVNANGIIEFVNEVFTKVLGYEESEVLGRYYDFLVPDRFKSKHRLHHETYLTMSKTAARRMGNRFLPAVHKDGHEIITEIGLNTYFRNNQRQIIIILQDVSELQQQRDATIRQNELLRKITWELVHETRAPLSNILGTIQLLERDLLVDEQDRQDLLDRICRNARDLDKALHRVVDDLSDGRANSEPEFRPRQQ